MEEETKVFIAKIIDYNYEEGLTVEKEEDKKILKIKKENITYVKLEFESKK